MIAMLKEIGIDYPRPSELVQAGTYTFRITASSDAKDVRVSINDGHFLAARPAEGHWWLDWTPDRPGKHFAISRVIAADGSLLVSQPRLFQVASSN